MKNKKDIKIKILAQALYEIRLLIGQGGKFKDTSEEVAGNIAYLLHNDALAILEDREEDFNVDNFLEKLEYLDEEGHYSTLFQNLVEKENEKYKRTKTTTSKRKEV